MDSHRRRRPLLAAGLKVITINCMLIGLLLNSCGAERTTATPKDKDSLLVARCRSSCNHQYGNKTCQVDCANDFFQNAENGKPGDCLHSASTSLVHPNFTQSCTGVDYDCPDIQKCCFTTGGRVCQMPHGLDKIRHLPPTPSNLKLTRSDHIPHRRVYVEWELPVDLDHYGQIYFVLQSRSHVGNEFVETKFNHFSPHHVLTYYEDKTPHRRTYSSTVKLNPGRWYQFRVASVNAYGTRGFSTYTKPFQLSKRPNPPKPPRNVTLDPFRLGANRTLTQKIYWQLPKSDIPVQKYRISWSLYINGINESLLKEMATVAEPKRHFEIRDLLPNSMYYLQIQAISLFGIKRLKSEPATKLINTTLTSDMMGQLEQMHLQLNSIITTEIILSKKSIATRENGATNNREIVTIVPTENEDFRIKFVANRRFGLIVRTDLRLAHERIRVEICNGTDACLTKKGLAKPQVIVSKRPRHDFTNLSFNRKYTIGFKLLTKSATNKPEFDYKTTFVTPTCESYRKTYKKLDIQCQSTVADNTTNTYNGPATNRVRRKNIKKKLTKNQDGGKTSLG